MVYGPAPRNQSSASALELSALNNKDLAPVATEQRTWSMWSIAALWVGMAICITTYTLASSLIERGMNWKQAVLTIFLGNTIVLIPMTLNAHLGTAYGIPFPVLIRASFGTRGSNIPALLRTLVTCGWFGGAAIYTMAAIVFGFDPTQKTPLPILGISAGEFACFLVFWVINIFVIVRGMDSIRWLEVVAAPFLILTGVGLLVWAVTAAKGRGPIFAQPSKFRSLGDFWPVFTAGLTAMVAYWATLSLNIPEFSRFARSQRDQIVGQTLGLPLSMTFYAFIGVAVTSATVVVFGKAIWDPVQLMQRFHNPVLAVLAVVTLTIATLSTNIAADVVSPANDFSNLAPRLISFKNGGVLTGIIGVLMFPWKLYADPSGGYIFTWLIGYSALLGPIGGIMIAEYFVYRKRQLDVPPLYDSAGRYRYRGGFSPIALGALTLSVLPNIPGFLVTIKALPAGAVAPIYLSFYRYAWFIGFAFAFVLYLVGRRLAGDRA